MSIGTIYRQSIENQILNNCRAQAMTRESLSISKETVEKEKIVSKARITPKVSYKYHPNVHQYNFAIAQVYEMSITKIQDLFIIFLIENRIKELKPKYKQKQILVDQRNCLKYVVFPEDYQMRKYFYFSDCIQDGFEAEKFKKIQSKKLEHSRKVSLKVLVRMMLNFEAGEYYLLRADDMCTAIQDRITLQIAQELKLYQIELKKVDQNSFLMRLVCQDCYETTAQAAQLRNLSNLNGHIKELQLILKQADKKQAVKVQQTCWELIQRIDFINYGETDLKKCILYKINSQNCHSLDIMKRIENGQFSGKIAFKQILQQLKNPKLDSSKNLVKEARQNQFIKNHQKVNYSQYLKEISTVLSKGHIGSLKSVWSHSLRDTLTFLKQNWQVYSYQLREDVQNIIMLMDYKITRFRFNLDYEKDRIGQDIEFSKKEMHPSLFQQLYPGASELVDSFVILLSAKKFLSAFKQYKNQQFKGTIPNKFAYFQTFHFEFKKIFDIVDNPVDEMVTKYALERLLQKISPQPKDMCIKQQGFSRPLHKCIYQQTSFSNGTSQFQDILTKIDYLIDQADKRDLLKKKTNPQSNEKQLKLLQTDQIKENYLKNIEIQKICNVKCLGCSSFFYYRTNIGDSSINEVPTKLFPSIKKLKDYESLIKDQICAMLNSSGGVILFGCEGKYKNIKVLGQKLTERNKQDCQQILQYMVRGFYPKIQYNKHIQLTFVPVVQSPYSKQTPCQIETYKGEEGIIKQNQHFLHRNYMKGVFVPRIRVNPTQNHLTYAWESKDGSESRFYSFVSHNSKTQQLKGRQFIKAIKRNFKRNYIANHQLNSFQRELLKESRSCFNKPCPAPQSGYKITEIDGSHDTLTIQKEDIFNYMSLLIVKDKYLKQVQRKLKYKNIDFFIQQKFKSHNFHSAKGTYILYHNISFDQLLKAISYDEDFRFQGRLTIIIYISEYLKFGARDSVFTSCPLSQYQMINAIRWLKRQFPNQTIKYYQFKTQTGLQYYASTDSRLSTLYMYYLFNQNKRKTLLKSPQHLSELSSEERNALWRQLPITNYQT